MQINRKKIIIIVSIAIIAVLLGGIYIWYTNNYGNMKKVQLEENTSLEYEWKSVASEAGITGDYLWARTKELMLGPDTDGILIPSNLMIAGRLVTEPQEDSGIFRLSDQALLLSSYVRRGDRFAATKLVNEVNSRFDFASESNYEKSSWLLAFMEYYASFGKASDYDQVENLVSLIFDENGNVRPEQLSVASYNDTGYVSTDNLDDDGHSTISEIYGEGEITNYDFSGVVLSSVNLKLIKTLEDSNLLPVGSFESNSGVVLDGLISDSVSLYAYAYEVLDDGTLSYINVHKTPAAVDIYESVLTMRNLSEVGLLPSAPYLWLKNTMINNPYMYSTYYFITGQLGGDESVDSYTDILHIAINMDDQDLFSRVIRSVGSRVATYNNSPALSMVYRSQDDRYVFYARENLELELILF